MVTGVLKETIRNKLMVTGVLKETIRNKLMVFERKVLRKIFGPTKERDGT